MSGVNRKRERVVQHMRFFIVALLSFSSTLLAQVPEKGLIRGSVLDAETGEPLIGANVVLAGTVRGAATDLDGFFTIPSLDPGNYTVVVSVVSYAKQTITGVAVRPGESSSINVALRPEVIQTDEVVIEAKASAAYEGALLTRQKNASAIGDGLSAEQIKRAPDATSGDALKRVTGVSVVDNKFIFVRGVTDRYNQTTLNGTSVASTSADKKGFQFDLLPSALLENTVVTKSATPDLPGDFSGGLVQLTTMDFPENRVLKASLTGSWNSVTTGKTVFASQGGSRDWLGIDDGSRAFPAQASNNQQLAQDLPNTWAPRTASAPFGGSMNFSYGDQFGLGTNQLGVLTSLAYRTSTQRSNLHVTDTRNEALIRDLTGSSDKYSVLWGGLLDVSMKLGGFHKLSLKNNYNRTADDIVTRTQGFEENDGNQVNSTIEWSERSVYTGQLAGEHVFPTMAGVQLQWQTHLSMSTSDQPDRRAIQYSKALEYTDADPFISEPGERSWASMDEQAKGAKLDVSVPVSSFKIKFGAQVDRRDRSYGIEYYQINYLTLAPQNFGLLILPLETIYEAQNFGPGKFGLTEISKPSDQYSADQTVLAGYAMVDLPFTLGGERFRLVGGARLENSDQKVNTTLTYASVEAYTVRLKNIDILPSLNLTYTLNSAANLRLAYSQTVNRPEFRELANVYFYDFNSYEARYGNPDLQRAHVRNYDARLELFPDIAELVAASFFYKGITNAIEEQVIVSSNPTRTWFNSARGKNYGWEIEMRKSLGFLGGAFRHFAVAGNYTRIYSAIEFTETTGSSANPQTLTRTRPMQGQSPYMVNVSLIFSQPDWGTGFTVLLNRIGQRIDAVGYLDDDIYEQARSVIDLTLSQDLSSWANVKFSVRDLLGQDELLTRRGEDYRRVSRGTSYSVQLGLNL